MLLAFLAASAVVAADFLGKSSAFEGEVVVAAALACMSW